MKRLKTIAVSMAALCIATILAIGGTYALFTGKAEVNNHLVAGNLKIGMVQTNLVKRELDTTTGLMKDTTDGTDVDLVTNGKQVFEYKNVVPTTAYTSTIEITNEGSVAFEYNARIIWDKGENPSAEDIALAEQIEITITVGDKTKTFKLSECYEESSILDLGTFKKNDPKQIMTVYTEFVNITDSTENNDAMLGEVSFDIQIDATQSTQKVN